uniref:Uncharacterized protein n=1 Tax=Arundo donax TaxID=35708 RepID=A0A0A8XW83_ARUDO
MSSPAKRMSWCTPPAATTARWKCLAISTVSRSARATMVISTSHCRCP